MFGQKTGDTVCDDCGEAFAPGETISPVEFRDSMIVSPHALLVALSINTNLVLAKDAAGPVLVYDWALVDKATNNVFIPVAADIAIACVDGGYVSGDRVRD